jgi:hypothetical protein
MFQKLDLSPLSPCRFVCDLHWLFFERLQCCVRQWTKLPVEFAFVLSKAFAAIAAEKENHRQTIFEEPIPQKHISGVPTCCLTTAKIKIRPQFASKEHSYSTETYEEQIPDLCFSL